MYTKILKKLLTEKRYNHVIRVCEMAEKLALKYNVPLEKVKTAALLHDIAKYFPDEKALSLIEDDYNHIFHNGFKTNAILHGFAGASYVKKNLNINDIEILNAIRYHTIGRENMSLIEKIVYLADAIEMERNFEDVNLVREIAFIDLNKAILLEINLKIKYLFSKNSIIHPNVILLRNELIREGTKI